MAQAKVEGVLKVYFFDTEAGAKNISNTRISARSNPQVLEVLNLDSLIIWPLQEKILMAITAAVDRTFVT